LGAWYGARVRLSTPWLVACLLVGCNPNPSLEQAREYYAAHRGTVEAVETELQARVERVSAAASRDCGMDTGCELERIEARNQAIRELPQEMLSVFDRRHVIGLDAMDGNEVLVDVGLTPGGLAHGRVPASERKLEIDGRAIGWGAYQTSFSSSKAAAGDGELRHGIEVEWAGEAGTQHYTATLYLLAKDETTSQWRDAIRAQEARD
jgi:hypothetical protein